MPKKFEEKIHILSPTRAYFAPAKVMGPIVHPLLVEKKVAVQILMSGAEVHEYIPQNKKTIKLTLTNINDPHRYDTILPKVVKDAAPAIDPVLKHGVPMTGTLNLHPVKPAINEPKVEEPVIVSEPVVEVEFIAGHKIGTRKSMPISTAEDLEYVGLVKRVS